MSDTDHNSELVSRRTFVAAAGSVGIAALAGCSETGNGGEDGGGEVTVTGSSTVHPVSDTMAERFMDENDGINVTTDPTGTGGGFANNFCPGDSDVNGASRPIQPEEEESCGENDVNPIEFEIAGDAITMAVNQDNPVEQVTYDELAQIWQEDAAETWADVNSDWPDEEIIRFGPDSTSGTFDWFTENVVGEAGNHTDNYEPTEDDNTIVQNITENEFGVGYFGYSYYRESEDRLKALEVSESGDEFVEPSLDAARDGSYPMARPLYIYVSEDSLSDEPVYDFVEYYLENTDADFIADEVGYVPSNSEQVEDNLSTLEEYQ